ncbi:fibronectin type-III domain-containing protein [Trichonephila clavipes]|nr:fibronectin type-III domain-containing protein [Trichonephila clavipes]
MRNNAFKIFKIIRFSFISVDLGNIGDITLEDVTSSSLTLVWFMASSTKWQQPSYLVEWESTDENRKKREADNQLIVKDSGITIGDLKPDTSYRVSVTPYTDTTQIGGSPKEITVSTKEGKDIESIVATIRNTYSFI